MAGQRNRDCQPCDLYVLPPEIRRLVLIQLAQDEHRDGHALSGYATVAKEWQPVFEQQVFRRVRVKRSHLGFFQATFQVMRRRKYLRFLRLDLELPSHEHISPGVSTATEQQRAVAQIIWSRQHETDIPRLFPELEAQQKQNNVAFTEAIYQLFAQLATWTPAETCRGGLGLEVVEESQSYWQQMARRLRNAEADTENWPQGPRTLVNLQIDEFSWETIIRAAELDLHLSLKLDFPGSMMPSVSVLPDVHIVSSFCIRKRTVRHFEPAAIGAMLQSLPSAAIFNWERWPRAYLTHRDHFGAEFRKTVPHWPLSLKMIRVCLNAVAYQWEDPTTQALQGHIPSSTLIAAKSARRPEQLTHSLIQYKSGTPDLSATYAHQIIVFTG